MNKNETGQLNEISRRKFLMGSAAGAVAVGIFAFPPGLETVETISPGVSRVTRNYPRLKVANTADLVDGAPVDFNFPFEEHNNFLVKLGSLAKDGAGAANDIVAFSYLCFHMGCPPVGQYNHGYKMLGPCFCHFSSST